MALIINHNMTAQNAARNLGTIYDRLSTSVQRLSSGLRINSAADDAAGLAVREMMRADIATMNQGIRNTADAISMIQTADGALSIIDEKLTRMKELAEQAATGTYTTAQREIINSEYQAMAAEIDRIANATNFNGIKLLDGSVTNQHGGQGLKIHFGVSNNAAEDYYFVNIGDARATSETGLRIGGDALNDIWGQGAAGAGPLAGPGCCTAGYSSLDGAAGFIDGETFSYGYNWDWMQDEDSALLTGKYLAGRYTVSSSQSLQDLINMVNRGTQSRVGVQVNSAALRTEVQCGGTVAICIGDEAYYWGVTSVAEGGTQHTQEFNYEATINELFQGTGSFSSLFARSQSMANLLGGSNVVVSANVVGAESATAGIAALRAALVAAYTGSAVLSATAVTALATVVNATYLYDNFGVNDTQPPQGSANFATGIYYDGSGRWTTSATLGQALGMNQVTFNLPEAFALTPASPTYTNIADMLSGTGANQMAFSAGFMPNGPTSVNIWVSGSMWALSPASGALINGHKLTINLVGATSAALRAVDFVDADYLRDHVGGYSANVWVPFVSGTTSSKAVSSFVYVDMNTGRWTNIKAIGDNQGWQQINFNVSSTEVHFKGGGATNEPMVWLNDNSVQIKADLLAQFTVYSVGATTGAETFNLNGIYFQAVGTDSSAWTTDAALAARMTNRGVGFAQMTMTAGVGLSTDQELYDAMVDFYRAQAGIYTPGGPGWTHEIVQIGDGYTEARESFIAAYAAAVAGSSFSGDRDNMVLATGDDFTAAYNKIMATSPALTQRVGAMGGRSVAALTNAGGNFYDTVDALNLTSELQVSYLTATELTNMAIDPAALVVTEGAGVDVVVGGAIGANKVATQVGDANSVNSAFTYRALAEAINNNSSSQFWAMVQDVNSNGQAAQMVYIFCKDGGNNNDLLACDVAGGDAHSRAALDAILFENTETALTNQSGTSFSLGGQFWGTMKPTQTAANLGNQVWNVTLNGRDVGYQRDLWIANAGELDTPALTAGIINGMDRNSFVEIQNAANGRWDGAEVRTQSSAQEALDAISESINAKDKIRADLGAMQNRLENTMTNLTIQAENLQASESRISDVDVATEMTEFTRNNVLSQAATSMLAQANSLSQLALSLIR
jgi:flagellin-like hook-associated protein FlgL